MHICIQMSSFSHKSRTLNPRPISGEWVKKLCYIHTMEYYSGIKNKISIHVITSNLKITVLGERSHTKETTCHDSFHLYEILEKGEAIVTAD